MPGGQVLRSLLLLRLWRGVHPVLSGYTRQHVGQLQRDPGGGAGRRRLAHRAPVPPAAAEHPARSRPDGDRVPGHRHAGRASHEPVDRCQRYRTYLHVSVEQRIAPPGGTRRYAAPPRRQSVDPEIAADLCPSADGSAVRTSLVACGG